jgi:hypothetical protein
VCIIIYLLCLARDWEILNCIYKNQSHAGQTLAELTDEHSMNTRNEEKRSRLSHNIQLMEELRSSSKDCCNYLTMSEDNVMSLLEKVRHLIEKEDTVLRTAITAEERLAITIVFWPLDDHIKTLHFLQ